MNAEVSPPTHRWTVGACTGAPLAYPCLLFQGTLYPIAAARRARPPAGGRPRPQECQFCPVESLVAHRSDEDIALVRERARIDEVVSEYVTLRNAGGGNLKGLCPFHDEKTPSFHVTPERGFYYCFGCGAAATSSTS